MYAKYIKRILDVVLSFVALVCFSPILLVLIVIGAAALGGTPFFTQIRPGRIDKKTGQERLFYLLKFRTMTDKRDENGNLLSDEERLTGYGRFLRSTSLDELPQLINILKGDMSIVGPRPQLVRDMVFMTKEQRRRHTVRQGLTGLAQVNGRNATTWEEKLAYDLKYVDNITFLGDVKIVLTTVVNVFKREGITEDGMATAMDFGDYLLQNGSITEDEYGKGQTEANEMMGVL